MALFGLSSGSRRSVDMSILNLSDNQPARLRKPWEVLDEELLPELTVEEVFGDLKKLSQDGAYLKSCCPLHNGPEADAFSIDPERLEWVCFGGCGGGGPIQFLQKKGKSDWMEAAQTLAVMVGIDSSRLRTWGQHWTDDDFAEHAQLETRAGLLRMFMAMARSLFESKAGESTRAYLAEQFDSNEDQILRADLGLYGTTTDVFHFLKRSGFDVSDLKAAGFFEARWQGRVVAAWEDLGGRTVNLWNWSPSGISSDGPAPRGEILFENDSLGSQKTPFLLAAGLRSKGHDLVHFDDPLHAIAGRLAGLQDPFPIASQGRLAAEQIDTLDVALAEGGSLTLLPSYEPRKKTKRARNPSRDEKLLSKAGFPTFLIDSAIMARSRSEPMGPEQFIRQHNLEVFGQLLSRSEALASEEPSRGWGLGKVFSAGGPPKKPAGSSQHAHEDSSQSHVPALLGVIMGAAEEIGSRIARGFLKAMPGQGLPPPSAGAPGGQIGSGPVPGGARQLPPAEGPFQSAPQSLADPRPGGLLPAAPESPPETFSVDRLERRSLSSALAKSTGWKAVDELEVLFRPGELTVVGGESGHGRTTFLAGILQHWLFKTREEFVYYSFDESETQIYHRLLSLVTVTAGLGWSLTRVRNHFSSRKDRGPDPEGTDFDTLTMAREHLRKWENRFRLVFRASTEPARILAELEPLSKDGNLGAVFIDSLDGLQSDPDSQLSLGAQLKTLAVTLNCPVIVSSRTSQLTQKRKAVAEEISQLLADEPENWQRLLEKLERCRPTVDEFAPEIEKEADMLLGLLNCASLYPSQSHLPEKTLFEVGVIKNRSGPAGAWVLLALERRVCRLVDLGK